MRTVCAALLLVALTAGAAARSWEQPFVPVGVVNDSPNGFGTRQDLEYFRKLRFNVVARPDPAAPLRLRVETVAALLGGTAATSNPIAPADLEIIEVSERSRGAEVRQRAWMAIGRGVRGVLFNQWKTLGQNPDALAAAATFADNVTRNAALFGPLRPTSRQVGITAASSDISARFVESSDAIVLIAANPTNSDQQVTLTFSPDVPEAIWQNMETGAAVDFVAGPDGPTYTRTFAPFDVVVLMIRKPRGGERIGQ